MSQYMVEGEGNVVCNSLKRDCTQLASALLEATTWYLASMEERATVNCFFKHQETGFLPRYKTNAVVEV